MKLAVVYSFFGFFYRLIQKYVNLNTMPRDWMSQR